MDNEIVERIELKIAFLERANHELSDVVYRQQQELDALRLQLTNAMGRIDELKQEARPYTQQEERPPHY
ncbi:MAG TPA: SlyX family protein [Steroidobacteraceae bacterium]|nr:SlyX family protein [Steroidobacteraceae bacterium]